MAILVGRAAARDIRAALAGIGKQLNRKLTPEQSLKLLEHQARLMAELRALGVESLEKRIANPDKG
jgi:hypothetical protein